MYRTSVCWKCHEPVDSSCDKICHVCGWIICHSCFSCKQHGCFGKADILPSQRRALRRLHLENNVSSELDLQEWCISAIEQVDTMIREEEEARLLALRAHNAAIIQQRIDAELARKKEIEALRDAYCPGTIVSNVKHDIGTIDKYGIVDGREFVYVLFGSSTSRFLFPSCFENGFLKNEHKKSQ